MLRAVAFCARACVKFKSSGTVYIRSYNAKTAPLMRQNGTCANTGYVYNGNILAVL